jgi:hypothetical protein
MPAWLDPSRAASVFVALACTGCMSAAVFDYRGDDPPPPSYGAIEATLAINDLAIPNTRTEIVAPNTPETERFGTVRFNALEERLTELFGASQLVSRVRRSRDLSREGIPSPGFVVQYRIQSYSASSSDDPGGVAAGIIGTILTGGVTGGFLVFAATKRHEHHFQVEARLYRAEDSRLISMSAPRSGERIAQYDTAGAELLWSESRQLVIRSGHCMVCAPGGADAERFHREEGRQMARVIFDETASDLREQMRNALASRSAAPAIAQQAVTSGGEQLPEFESPQFASAVRARLDERAARIVLCANADSAAVIVEWSGAGAAAVSVRDADEDTIGCVRAAVGELQAPAGTPAGRVLHVVSR